MNQTQQHLLFSTWTTEHRALLHHVVNAFANLADRADLMQDILIAIWKAIPYFRSDSKPSTFVYRVAHNTAMTWRRAQSNYRRRVEQAGVAVSVDPANHEREEQLEQLYGHIRLLPPLDRSLLLLWLDEVSYRDMAEIHGVDENFVGVRLTRARAKLIEQMKELYT